MKKEVWIHCPLCQSQTDVKVYEDTVLLNFPLCCPMCKKVIEINLVQLKMVLVDDDK